MTILVPDKETLPGSIGNAAITRNGLKNVATRMVATIAAIPAGMAKRRRRTKRLCRAAARNTRSLPFRPIWRGARELEGEMIEL